MLRFDGSEHGLTEQADPFMQGPLQPVAEGAGLLREASSAGFCSRCPLLRIVNFGLRNAVLAFHPGSHRSLCLVPPRGKARAHPALVCQRIKPGSQGNKLCPLACSVS